MKLQWHNIWMHKDWQDMPCATMEEANRFLMDRMPYTEEGTRVRNAETGETFRWKPPRQVINFGP